MFSCHQLRLAAHRISVKERVDRLRVAVQKISHRLGCAQQPEQAHLFFAAISPFGNRRVFLNQPH